MNDYAAATIRCLGMSPVLYLYGLYVSIFSTCLSFYGPPLFLSKYYSNNQQMQINTLLFLFWNKNNNSCMRNYQYDFSGVSTN